MNILRRLVLFLAAGLFSLALWALAVDIGLVKTFGNSENVKKLVADSGIYDSIVASALEQANQEQKQPGADGSEVPVADPVIKAAAQKAISPQFLQKNVENIIDSIYGWLEGKTPQPDFTIDLSEVKTNLANYVAQDLQQRLAGLPTCPANTPTQNFDFYSATCLPKDVTAAAAADQVKTQINDSQDFLGDTSIAGSDVKSPDTNRPIFSEQLKDLPKAYQGFKSSPLYLALLAIVTGLAVILLSTSRRRGLKRVGIVLLAIGVLILLFAWLLNYGTSNKNFKLNFENKVLQDKVNSLISDVSRTVGKTYSVVGGAYAGLGLVAILGATMIGKRKAGPEPAAVEEKHEAAEPTPPLDEPKEPVAGPPPLAKEVKAAPKPKKKPTTRKIKIQ